MSGGSDKTPLSANSTIQDPLGEIRALAQELWERAGSPKNRDVASFMAEAERQMLSGMSKGSPSNRSRKQGMELKKNILSDLIEQEENQSLSVLASAFKSFLNEHEAICLAYFLRDNELTLKNGDRLPRFTIDSISEILANLCDEYEAQFIRKFNATEAGDIPYEDRLNYWQKKTTASFEKDVPLTYADGNTIRRLADLVGKEPKVQRILFLG